MLIPRNTKVRLARVPADFRKSIDGLSGLVRSALDDDPSSGQIFVFHDQRRIAIEGLWWYHGGFCLLYKRLVKGRFRLPFFPDHSLYWLGPSFQSSPVCTVSIASHRTVIDRVTGSFKRTVLQDASWNTLELLETPSV